MHTETPLAVAIAKDHIIPGYRNLADAAAKQADTWYQDCATPSLKQHFFAVSRAWAGIEHITMGPAELLLRRDRLYHWPERRNAVHKALIKLANKQNDSATTVDMLAKGSVAPQGLPALERLIFDKAWTDHPHRCALGQMITKNIAIMARDLHQEWITGEWAILPKLIADDTHPMWFETRQEFINRIYTDLLTGFKRITDIKLAPVMGSSIDKAKPKMAEFWRSGHSTTILQHNGKGMANLLAVMKVYLPPDQQNRMEIIVKKLHQAAGILPRDLAAASIDDVQRQKLVAYKTALRDVRNEMVDILHSGLDLTAGFNNLDGD